MKEIASIIFSIWLLITLAEAREKEPYCTWKDGITEQRLDASDTYLFSKELVGIEKKTTSHRGDAQGHSNKRRKVAAFSTLHHLV